MTNLSDEDAASAATELAFVEVTKQAAKSEDKINGGPLIASSDATSGPQTTSASREQDKRPSVASVEDTEVGRVAKKDDVPAVMDDMRVEEEEEGQEGQTSSSRDPESSCPCPLMNASSSTDVPAMTSEMEDGTELPSAVQQRSGDDEGGKAGRTGDGQDDAEADVDSTCEETAEVEVNRPQFVWSESQKHRMRVSDRDTQRAQISKKISYVLRHFYHRTVAGAAQDGKVSKIACIKSKSSAADDHDHGGWMRASELLEKYMTEPHEPQTLHDLLIFLKESNEEKARYEIRGEDSILEVRANRRVDPHTGKSCQPRSNGWKQGMRRKQLREMQGSPDTKYVIVREEDGVDEESSATPGGTPASSNSVVGRSQTFVVKNEGNGKGHSAKGSLVVKGAAGPKGHNGKKGGAFVEPHHQTSYNYYSNVIYTYPVPGYGSYAQGGYNTYQYYQGTGAGRKKGAGKTAASNTSTGAASTFCTSTGASTLPSSALRSKAAGKAEVLASAIIADGAKKQQDDQAASPQSSEVEQGTGKLPEGKRDTTRTTAIGSSSSATADAESENPVPGGGNETTQEPPTKRKKQRNKNNKRGLVKEKDEEAAIGVGAGGADEEEDCVGGTSEIAAAPVEGDTRRRKREKLNLKRRGAAEDVKVEVDEHEQEHETSSKASSKSRSKQRVTKRSKAGKKAGARAEDAAAAAGARDAEGAADDADEGAPQSAASESPSKGPESSNTAAAPLPTGEMKSKSTTRTSSGGAPSASSSKASQSGTSKSSGSKTKSASHSPSATNTRSAAKKDSYKHKRIDERLFFAKYGMDEIAQEKLHELSDAKQQEAMRRFNPVKSVLRSEYSRVFMTYVRRYQENERREQELAAAARQKELQEAAGQTSGNVDKPGGGDPGLVAEVEEGALCWKPGQEFVPMLEKQNKRADTTAPATDDKDATWMAHYGGAGGAAAAPYAAAPYTYGYVAAGYPAAGGLQPVTTLIQYVDANGTPTVAGASTAPAGTFVPVGSGAGTRFVYPQAAGTMPTLAVGGTAPTTTTTTTCAAPGGLLWSTTSTSFGGAPTGSRAATSSSAFHPKSTTSKIAAAPAPPPAAAGGASAANIGASTNAASTSSAGAIKSGLSSGNLLLPVVGAGASGWPQAQYQFVPYSQSAAGGTNLHYQGKNAAARNNTKQQDKGAPGKAPPPGGKQSKGASRNAGPETAAGAGDGNYGAATSKNMGAPTPPKPAVGGTKNLLQIDESETQGQAPSSISSTNKKFQPVATSPPPTGAAYIPFQATPTSGYIYAQTNPLTHQSSRLRPDHAVSKGNNVQVDKVP